jgi:hypothetical protein
MTPLRVSAVQVGTPNGRFPPETFSAAIRTTASRRFATSLKHLKCANTGHWSPLGERVNSGSPRVIGHRAFAAAGLRQRPQ